jgi:hypothetical protein
MRWTILGFLIILVACNNSEENTTTSTRKDTLKSTPKTTETTKEETPASPTPSPKKYSNKRFRDVTVERIGKDEFVVRGQAQVFEAAFSWIVEDGHEELKKGFQMTDAGAPAWGNFEFKLNAPKKRDNSTLTLILFESSAKDGSRQDELPIVLY